jgi:hypothetical protein
MLSEFCLLKILGFPFVIIVACKFDLKLREREKEFVEFVIVRE